MEIKGSELGKQLFKPTGDEGKQVGETMNMTNANIHSLVFSIMDIKPREQILEIGFGNGKHFSEYFKTNRDVTVTGIDFSDIMCNEATTNNAALIAEKKLHLINSNFIDFNEDRATFDRIVAINNVYFWKPFERYINRIHRIMKSGGELIIGLRPKSVMSTQPFVTEDFTLFEQDELSEMISQHDFILSDAKTEKVKRTSADGKTVESIDICLRFTKR